MIYTIKNDCLAVKINDFGAELQEITGADGTSYLWNGDPKYWKGHAPVLFPFVARLYNKTYTMDGETYQMEIHGIVKYNTLEVTSRADDSITFTLKSNAELKKIYPRDFIFNVRYYLTGNKLNVEYTVENTDSREMAFGLGGHPGINVPMAQGLAFEDYYLKFEKDNAKRVIFSPDLYVSGKLGDFKMESGRVPLTHSLFDDEAVVLQGSGNKVTIMSDKDSHSVTVDYSDFEYVGFWQAIHTDAPYVCVEPWGTLPAHSGEIKNFNTCNDLLRLAPGQTLRKEFSLEMRGGLC